MAPARSQVSRKARGLAGPETGGLPPAWAFPAAAAATAAVMTLVLAGGCSWGLEVRLRGCLPARRSVRPRHHPGRRPRNRRLPQRDRVAHSARDRKPAGLRRRVQSPVPPARLPRWRPRDRGGPVACPTWPPTPTPPPA